MYKKIHFGRKISKECSKELCLLHSKIERSLYKKKHKCPHINPLKRLEAVDYPINQGNPKNLFKTNSESYLEIFIKR